MEVAISLTKQLEGYFTDLGSTVAQWEDWLNQQQKAVVEANLETLQSLNESSQGLLSQLEEFVAKRKQLLSEAAAVGLRSNDLKGLAKKLTQVSGISLEELAMRAQLHMNHLKRLHVATWVLLFESSQLLAGTMSVLLEGQSTKHVYQDSSLSDTGGGQLIDTDI